MLGGNFVRAIPERGKMEEAWRSLDLTVSISTKLNRSHLVHGKASDILLAWDELKSIAKRVASRRLQWRIVPVFSMLPGASRNRPARI
jgi:hypothetical protein